MTNIIKNKQRVLFLCTGNSARSQIAEALLRHHAADQFEVFSAGTRPEGVDPRTLAVLAQFGVSSLGLNSKKISDFSGQGFDYVITLCDNASQECRDFSDAQQQMAWDLPDPKTMAEQNPFLATLYDIDNRLKTFIELTTGIKLSTSQTLSQALSPNQFYKCLTDELRLQSLMLANYHGELCVCELMQALDEESQPKVSRNLAVLKKAGIIIDRKHGQWVFYRINPELPLWMKNVISETTHHNTHLIALANQRLLAMRNRPSKASFCR